MVTEVQHFIADNDPEETRWSSFAGAAAHEERIVIANRMREHIEALYGKHTDTGEITLAAYIELVNIANGAEGLKPTSAAQSEEDDEIPF